LISSYSQVSPQWVLYPFLRPRFADGFALIELRLLFQVADLIIRIERDPAFVIGIQAGNNFQQSGFTGTIQTQYADLGAVEKAEPNIFENRFIAGRKVLETPSMAKMTLLSDIGVS
jgi:hypothetical protein